LPVGDSWRVDETYLKVRGQWVYLYRAVDKQGRTVDFLLSRRRHIAAAQRFFSRATRQHGAPRVITLDGYAASHRAVDKLKEVGTLPCRVQVRSCKYHRFGALGIFNRSEFPRARRAFQAWHKSER
jgi:transposase-like protein